jgi:hypothetical protein
VAKAIEPVRPWYESDEHPPRELAAIVADIVSDLQSDRAECLRKSMLSDDQVKHMVNRFLMWKLPDNFNPDGGVSFEPEYNVEYNAKQGLPPQRHEPSGTNLLDYTQAEAMVRHMLDGLTQPQPDAAVAVERERCAKIAECAFDDRGNGRSGHHSEMDWTDGYRDGTRAAAAAIRAGGQPFAADRQKGGEA